MREQKLARSLSVPTPGENGVLAIFHVDARGRSSRVELTQRFALHVRFKDGKLCGVSATRRGRGSLAVGLA